MGPTLEAAGFKDTKSEWFNQSFGSQYSVYSSSASKIRLVWGGHNSEFYLECDRLPNETQLGAWSYLTSQSFNTKVAEDQRVDELCTDISAALRDYLVHWVTQSGSPTTQSKGSGYARPPINPTASQEPKGNPMTETNLGKAHPAIAVLVGVWSIGWWQYLQQVGPEDWLVSLIGIGLGLAGLFVATLLWRGRRRAPSAYAWWAVADVVGLAIADARVEPVLWKVALGSVLAGLILGSVAVYLRGPRPSSKSPH